jgi:hypothetical protein
MMADIMATEPTENTERNNTRFNNIFVSFRGFRGYQRNTDTRLDSSISGIFKLKMHYAAGRNTTVSSANQTAGTQAFRTHGETAGPYREAGINARSPATRQEGLSSGVIPDSC